MTAHERLERSYRRLLRCFPGSYRADREAEMLGVLLEIARPGQQCPDLADVGDLLVAAGRAWWWRCWTGLRPRLPVVAAALVLILPLAIALFPATAALRTPSSRPATLPSRFADYSSATGSVSDAPVGRAVALYRQGTEPAQDVVLAADRDAYRRLDLAASHRTGADAAGTQAPAELSPDGTRVAVGYFHAKSAQLSVQDLADGGATSYPLPAPGGSVDDAWGVGAIPLAWSPDGARIAYAVVPAADATIASSAAGSSADGGRSVGDAGTGSTGSVDVGVLDLSTGRAVVVTRTAGIASAAFGPAGTELAVQEPSGGPIRVTALDGTVRRVLTPPLGMALAGPAAWSPDERLIAVSRMRVGCPDRHDSAAYPGWCQADRTAFIDASRSAADVRQSSEKARGATSAVTAPVVELPAELGTDVRHQFVGWSAAGRVVVARANDDGGVDLLDVPLAGVAHLDGVAGGEIRQLSTIGGDRGNYPVGTVQLATGLLGDLRVRASTTPDRGRWPTTWRLAAAAAATALLWPTIVFAARLRRRQPPRLRHLPYLRHLPGLRQLPRRDT